MNRIYKSIFNEQTGTYVAVSENTKNKGKKGNKVLAATALSAALGFGAMGSAQAQLVSACAGVSLPRSVVTGIVGEVLVPVVTPIETTVNGLLGPISTILGALSLGSAIPGPLSIDLTGILANAANGDPIRLDVLNQDGQAVAPSDDCNLTADSLNLTDPAGIAIGGNTITGLGSDAAGAAAVSSAADFTSIAFGNYSQATQSKAIAFGEAAQATGVGSLALGADAKSSALNATSLGTNARANAANSVALGAGSVATQADTISVGRAAGTDGVSDPGLTRRITNLAEGITLTDAVNLGQLNDAITNINTNGLVRQPNPSDNITVGQETQGVAVDFSGSTTTPSGVEAYDRKLIGVAAGDITKADSNEAVTGGQLYTTNKYIADALGGDAAVNLDGTLKAPEYELTYGTPGLTAGKHDNVGSVLGELAGHVGSNAVNIANNTTNITKLLGGEVGIVKQDATTRNITVGGETDGKIVNFTNKTGDARTLTGLANGELKTGSTDAVTGDQLFSTNTNLDSTLAALGGGAQVDPVSGTVTAPSYVLDDGTNTGVTTSFDNVGGALGNLDGRVTSNTGRITNIEGDITDITNDLGDLTANAVTYTDATKTAINLAGAGGTTISNLKDGEVSASSTEAINGAQLYRSTSDLAAALGGNSVVDADGNLTNVGYDFIAGTQTSVGDALLNLDTRVDSNTTNITNLMNGTSGLVQQANGTAPITVGVATGGTIVDFTGTDGVRKLTGVANGSVAAGSTDAITGDQLFTSSKSVADALGGGSTVDPTTGAVSAPEYELDDGTDSGTKVTVTGVEDALTNLDGRVASNTTEITTIKGDISNIQTDITNITNGTLGIVKQNATTRVITVGGDTDGTEVNFAGTAGVRKLTGIANGNVAAGSTEAVTGDQLNTTNVAVAAALTALGGGHRLIRMASLQDQSMTSVVPHLIMWVVR